MGKQILETDITRQKETLYYCGTSKSGHVTVCEAKMARGGKKKAKKPAKKKVSK